jgi:hypothetical protein
LTSSKSPASRSKSCSDACLGEPSAATRARVNIGSDATASD